MIDAVESDGCRNRRSVSISLILHVDLALN